MQLFLYWPPQPRAFPSFEKQKKKFLCTYNAVKPIPERRDDSVSNQQIQTSQFPQKEEFLD